MAGLNIRLNDEGTFLYYRNKPNFIAKIDLSSEGFATERVFSHKELDDLVKFEADILESEVVMLSSEGTLKVTEKNMCYKMSTKSKFIYSNT